MYLTQVEIHGGERKKNYIYFFYRLDSFTYEIIYKSQYTVLYVGPERGRSPGMLGSGRGLLEGLDGVERRAGVVGWRARCDGGDGWLEQVWRACCGRARWRNGVGVSGGGGQGRSGEGGGLVIQKEGGEVVGRWEKFYGGEEYIGFEGGEKGFFEVGNGGGGKGSGGGVVYYSFLKEED